MQIFRTPTNTLASCRQMGTMRRPQGSQPNPNTYTVRQVLKSWLNGKNKVQTINMYDLLIIRYPTDIISWPVEEIEGTDIKTRELLLMHGMVPSLLGHN